ncbi:hypothetical protein DPMN_031905 [Dreissena polymorpha]|uniref:Uncharacterized protein n=1 Tax=Dreissena polymorpha TaxID=45954 RepID=A0A9D4RIF6_DREPO|nr:hypothetical protein DPMN_031905 [Dreissena polymorpha]
MSTGPSTSYPNRTSSSISATTVSRSNVTGQISSLTPPTPNSFIGSNKAHRPRNFTDLENHLEVVRRYDGFRCLSIRGKYKPVRLPHTLQRSIPSHAESYPIPF